MPQEIFFAFIYIHTTRYYVHIGPPQVKCRLLISSIFYEMNFRHILGMLKLNL